MAGSLFASWWTRMSPYYTKVYQEIWVGVGVVSLVSYKLMFGGKKAVADKPAH